MVTMDAGAKWTILLIFSTNLLSVSWSVPVTDHDKPKLMYIMFDGFRYDYLEKQTPEDLPAFNKILKEGVRAKWTNPIFPTVSFPSWTSLVTGLYPESHGILGNNMYDSKEKDTFTMRNSETVKKPKWWTAEPIWTTATKAGLKTAQIRWSRCDVPIEGVTTDFCEPYEDENYKQWIFKDDIMKGLNRLQEGYDFVQVYSPDPDTTGHHYGPESQELKDMLKSLDTVLGDLLDKLHEKNLTDKVNIVIVSDHGMESYTNEKFELHDIDKYLDTTLVEKFVNDAGYMELMVPQENIQQVFDKVSAIPGMDVYKKEEIPEELHYKGGKYSADILIVAHQWNFIQASTSSNQIPPKGGTYSPGVHSLAKNISSMRGIFFAKGPAFQEDLVIDPIDLVDVYQVLTKALDIQGRPHNGTWSNVSPAFISSLQNSSPKQRPSILLVPIALSLIYCCYLCMYH